MHKPTTAMSTHTASLESKRQHRGHHQKPVAKASQANDSQITYRDKKVNAISLSSAFFFFFFLRNLNLEKLLQALLEQKAEVQTLAQTPTSPQKQQRVESLKQTLKFRYVPLLNRQ